MRRLGIITALSMLLLALSASVAFAAVPPGTYTPTSGSFNTANAPGSSHLTSGTPSCTVNANLSIDCSAYVLGGVGHTNANVVLATTYKADVTCSNKGVNPQNAVEAQGTTFTGSTSTPLTSSKNGQLSVPAQSASFSGTTSGLCPNGNWTATFTNITLQSFSYTLTFAGFSSPYIEIKAP